MKIDGGDGFDGSGAVSVTPFGAVMTTFAVMAGTITPPGSPLGISKLICVGET